MSSWLLLSLILLIIVIHPLKAEDNRGFENWIETPTFKVLVKSTADWSRIMFDDQKGTNTNGLRVYQVISYGWIIGNDVNDIIDVGTDLMWYDIFYNGTATNKTGDIVAFFKQNNDFDYTEMYADIIFEVNEIYDQVYIFLMVAGQGTTTFEFINIETGSVVWREIISGNGGTQHIQRFMPTQLFLRSVKVESATVLSLTLITIFIVLILNVPKFKSTGSSKNK